MVLEFVGLVGQWAVDIIRAGGYWAILFLSFLDRVAVVLVPAEAILPLFGFLSQQGAFNIWWVMVIVTFGGLAGDIVLFGVSLKGGRWLVEKYGKYVLIKKHELDYADRLFSKHGGKLVVVSRFLPIIRSIISVPAGVAKMNFGKFVLFSIVGSLPWSFIFVFAGYKAGENQELIQRYTKDIDLLLIGAIAAAIIWYIYRHLKGRHVIDNG